MMRPSTAALRISGCDSGWTDPDNELDYYFWTGDIFTERMLDQGQDDLGVAVERRHVPPERLPKKFVGGHRSMRNESDRVIPIAPTLMGQIGQEQHDTASNERLEQRRKVIGYG